MKHSIQLFLKFLAHALIKKYHPKIVGVTGTVGKTSAKYAICAILESKFRVRADKKSLNSEIGFPLAILGFDIPGRSMWRWMKIFLSGIQQLLFYDSNFPEVLVLEYGADRPGDIAYLLEIAQPHIAVLTALSPVHLERFRDIDSLFSEKKLLLDAIAEDGIAILNIDFSEIKEYSSSVRAKIFTYSIIQPQANLYTTQIIHHWGKGVNAKIVFEGSSVPIFLHEAAGELHIGAVLAAVGVGIAFDMNLVEIAEAVGKYIPPPGRMHYLQGIKNVQIIDDSYNSSPKAALEAIRFLAAYKLPEISGKKLEKFAVMGDMNDLGAFSEDFHEEIGKYIAKEKIDWLITVGEKSKHMAEAARKEGMDEGRIISFDNSSDAGKFVQEKIEEGDIVLFKGSQNGIFLERAVKEILAEPLRAKELLVRQGPEWKI